MGLDAFVRCRCFLHTGQGWLSLATVIDLDARMVVGWACVRAHGR